MDETAVYFEGCRTQTIDICGRRHVVYHDAVLDTVSLIALEAYDFMCHSRAKYYICCICVRLQRWQQ
jgi:hypothetical protein